MALNPRVSRLLEEHGVAYAVVPHMEVFTAQEVARTSHVSGHDLAKVVVVGHGYGGYALVVLPGSRNVNLNQVHRLTGLDRLQFASEVELGKLFPDCEVGAIPPFGHLYGLPTYVDVCLLDKDWIYFQAGSHRELVRVRGADFEYLERPARFLDCVHEPEMFEIVAG